MAPPAHLLTYKIHAHPMQRSIPWRRGEVTRAITENYLTDRLIYFRVVVKPVRLSAASTANLQIIIDEITDLPVTNSG